MTRWIPFLTLLPPKSRYIANNIGSKLPPLEACIHYLRPFVSQIGINLQQFPFRWEDEHGLRNFLSTRSGTDEMKRNGVDLEYEMLSIRDLMILGSQHPHVRTCNLPLPALMGTPLLSAQKAWTLFIQMTENELTILFACLIRWVNFNRFSRL